MGTTTGRYVDKDSKGNARATVWAAAMLLGHSTLPRHQWSRDRHVLYAAKGNRGRGNTKIREGNERQRPRNLTEGLAITTFPAEPDC